MTTTVEQLPAALNLTIYQGGTFNLTLTWETGDPVNPVNLTGFSAAMKVKVGQDTILDLTDGDGITLGGTAGTIEITVEAVATAALTAPASAAYDLLLTSGTGVVTPLVAGLIDIRESVTGGA